MKLIASLFEINVSKIAANCEARINQLRAATQKERLCRYDHKTVPAAPTLKYLDIHRLAKQETLNFVAAPGVGHTSLLVSFRQAQGTKGG